MISDISDSEFKPSLTARVPEIIFITPSTSVLPKSGLM